MPRITRRHLAALATTAVVSAIAVTPALAGNGTGTTPGNNPPNPYPYGTHCGEPGSVCPISPEQANRAYLTLSVHKSKAKHGWVTMTVKVDTRWDSATARNVRLKAIFPRGTAYQVLNRKVKKNGNVAVVNLGTLSNVRLWKTTVFRVRASNSTTRVHLVASASNAPRSTHRNVVLPRRR